MWDCRSDSVLESFSFRVIEVGRIIEKMSEERVNMEATESGAKEENPEVWTVKRTLERHEVILV